MAEIQWYSGEYCNVWEVEEEVARETAKVITQPDRRGEYTISFPTKSGFASIIMCPGCAIAVKFGEEK